jgi:alcohol dehydrogenase class IV
MNDKRSFFYESLPNRVVFGVGSLQRLPEELDRLGSQQALLLVGSRKALIDDLMQRLGRRIAEVFLDSVMHVPFEVAQKARARAGQCRADALIAIGGGSAIGLAKAVALESGLPIVAVPTTYAGSEMTPIWGITAGAVKQTGRDLKVLPKVVLYDPSLTMDMPQSLFGASGMNAIAHCVEGLYAEKANPISSLMAAEGIRRLADGMRGIVRDPQDLDHRSEAQYGACLAGMVLGTVGMALHHKLSHVLGGSFNLPHAAVHAILLPHVAQFNADAAPNAMAKIADALNADRAPQGLYDLAVTLKVPTALNDIGMHKADLDRAAELATASEIFNPRPFNRRDIRRLLEAAYDGRPPL